jgi:predicted component of type VI protein secretion system
MTKEEKLQKLLSLRNKASDLKKDVDYYNSLQQALKLVLNGSY